MQTQGLWLMFDIGLKNKLLLGVKTGIDRK